MTWRVRDRATFLALRTARRARRGPVTVTWVPGSSSEPPRVAYAVGRRVGGAVARNRLRRRLRGVMTDLEATLPRGAYLISAGPDAVGLDYQDLRRTVAEAVQEVAERPENQT